MMDNFENMRDNNCFSNDVLQHRDSKLTVENLIKAKAMLRVKKCLGREEGDLILIYSERFTIGRSQIASLSVKVPEISRKQCTIRKKSFSTWEIIAEGAAGTYVNGSKLNVMETRTLECFDEIVLAGIISFIFNDYVAVTKPPDSDRSLNVYPDRGSSRSTSTRSRRYLDSNRDMSPVNWLARDTSKGSSTFSPWNDKPIGSLNPTSSERRTPQSTVVLSDEDIDTRVHTSSYNNDFVDSTTNRGEIGVEPAEEFMHSFTNLPKNTNLTTNILDNNEPIVHAGRNLEKDNDFFRPSVRNDSMEIISPPLLGRFVDSAMSREMTPLYSPSWDKRGHRSQGLNQPVPILNPTGGFVWSPDSQHKKRPFQFHDPALYDDPVRMSRLKRLCRFGTEGRDLEDGKISSNMLDIGDRRRTLFTNMMSPPREPSGPFSSNMFKAKEIKSLSPFRFKDNHERSELLETNRNLRFELEAAMEKCRNLIKDKKITEEVASEKLVESTKMVDELVKLKSMYNDLNSKYEAVSSELQETTGELEKFQTMYSRKDMQDIPNGIIPENVSYIKSMSESSSINEVLNLIINEHRANSENPPKSNLEDEAIAKIITQNEMIDKFSDLIETELQCAICNEILIKPSMLTCCHVFCRFCIDQWKKKETHCPICRKSDNTIISALVCENFIDKFIELFKPDLRENRDKIILEREEASREPVVVDDAAPRRGGVVLETIPMRLRHNMIVSLEAFRNGLGVLANDLTLPVLDNAAIIEDLTEEDEPPRELREEDPRERRRTRAAPPFQPGHQRETRRGRRHGAPQEWM